MRSFRVHGPDGDESFIRGTRYVVDDDGDLVVFTGDEEVQRIPAGSWTTIDAVGRPLAPTWPPHTLDLLLDRLHWETAVRYGFTEPVGTAADYSSPLLNELDAFVSRVALRLGLDPESTEHKQLYADLRDLVRRHFRTNT